MIHINLKIIGKVQGVFFRQSAKEKAVQLGVNGFVQNEPKGDVYIEAEGTEVQLDAFVSWCQKGPPRAEVVSVEMEYEDLVGFTGFVIKR
jgi:acylphosphatase